MQEYPKMLYKCPGPVGHNDGISYEPIIVDDADQEKAAVADGYELVVEDAWAKSQKPAETTDSREDMEKQAAEVGVTVDRRWSDSTLRQKIDEALAK
jgi:hypothetical protein